MDNLCSICLKQIKNKLTLNCSHSFCFDCLIKWLSIKNNCCLCRRTVKKEWFKELIKKERQKEIKIIERRLRYLDMNWIEILLYKYKRLFKITK